jgi:hypothetical protein
MQRNIIRSVAKLDSPAFEATERPPKFRNVLVHTSRYFSLAYCDEKGVWRNPGTGKALDGVQGWRYA